MSFFFEDTDPLPDFFSGPADIDSLSEAFSGTMDEWKEVSEEPLEDPGKSLPREWAEQSSRLIEMLDDPTNYEFNPRLSCVEQILPNSPEGEVTRTFIRQQDGEVDVYSMTEPDTTPELDTLVAVATRRKGAGRPRKRRITPAEGHRPEKRRVRHNKTQIDALVRSHGWSRAIGCCPKTVTNQVVCIGGENKPHHKSWYRKINKRLCTHLQEYHGFDLRVQEVPGIVKDKETGAVSVVDHLVCMQEPECGAKFENTPEGTYQCIKHLHAEHDVVHIIHKRDV